MGSSTSNGNAKNGMSLSNSGDMPLRGRSTNIITTSRNDDDDQNSNKDGMTRPKTPTNSLSSKSNSCLRLLYSNCRGLKSIAKLKALESRSFCDDLICVNEINYKATDSTLLVNKGLGRSAKIVALDRVRYDSQGKRVIIEEGEQGKKQGYGTAIISKKTSLIEYIDSTDEFEIVVGKIDKGGVKGLIITAYRSPSMKDTNEIKRFYDAISSEIWKNGGYKTNDFILYIADDNCVRGDPNLAAVNEAQSEMVERMRLVNLIGDVPTRGSRQPDSCFAYFNPSKIDISAMVESRIHADMDHNPISVLFRFEGIEPINPKYKIVERKVRIWDDEKFQS